MEENYKIETNNLIALCHVIDDFEDFQKKLLPIISPKYNRDFVAQLFEISYLKKNKIGARKARKFYEENKEIIDEINKHSTISRFINENYSYYGKSEGNLEFFYKYIMSHKEEIDKMLELLLKLKEIGFEHLKFNEEADFTQKKYCVASIFNYNYKVIYVANPEIIPNYDSSINYKTKDSSYEMEFETSIGTGSFKNYCKLITLNSLLFDIKTLPPKTDKENIFDVLVKLKNKQKEQSKKLQDVVNLSIGITDLETEILKINGMVTRLETVTNKEELLEVLASIREDMEKLKILSEVENNNIVQEEPIITPEIIKDEKKRCLKRRNCLGIDCC